MISFNRFSKLSTAFLILCGLMACSKTAKIAKPYRGNWVANVVMSEALTKRLSDEQKYKPEVNCIQEVTRDKTEDRITKIRTYLMFSPDACPTDGQVADREAFLTEVTKTRGSIVTQNPAVSFLITDGKVVGYLSEVKKEGKAPVVQIAELCTMEEPFRQNCELEFTGEGAFANLNTARSALGQLEREQKLQEDVRRVEQRVIDGTTDLLERISQSEKILVSNFRTSLTAARDQIVRQQYVSAFLTMSFVRVTQEQLEQSLNKSQNASFDALNRGLRAELENLRAEVVKKIEDEVGFHSKLIREQIGDLQDRVDAIEKNLLKVVRDRLDTLEDNLKASQWDAAWFTILWLELDLEDMETRLNKYLDDANKKQLKAFRGLLKKYSDDIKKEVKKEIVSQAKSLRTLIGDVETKLIEEGELNTFITIVVLQGELKEMEDRLIKKGDDVAAAQIKAFEALLKKYSETIITELRKTIRRRANALSDELGKFETRLKARLTEDQQSLVEEIRCTLAAITHQMASDQETLKKETLDPLLKKLGELEQALTGLDGRVQGQVRELRELLSIYSQQMIAELSSALARSTSRLIGFAAATEGRLAGTLNDSQIAAFKEADLALKTLEAKLTHGTWDEAVYQTVGAELALAKLDKALGAQLDARGKAQVQTYRASLRQYVREAFASLKSETAVFAGRSALAISLAADPMNANAARFTAALQAIRQLQVALASNAPVDNNAIRGLVNKAEAARAKIEDVLPLITEATGKRDLKVFSQYLEKLKTVNSPRLRFLLTAAELHFEFSLPLVGETRAQRQMMDQTSSLIAASIQFLFDGKLADSRAQLTDLAKLLASPEFKETILDNFAAEPVRVTRVNLAVKNLKSLTQQFADSLKNGK